MHSPQPANRQLNQAGQTPSGNGPMIFNALTLVIGVVLFLQAPTKVSSEFLTLTVLLGVLTIAAQALYKYGSERPVNWVSIDLVLLMAFFLVHFVYAFFFLVDWLPRRTPWQIARLNATSVICSTSALSVVGISALALGFNFHRAPPNRPIGFHHVPRKVFSDWCRLASVMVRSGAVLFVAWVFAVGVGNVFGDIYRGSEAAHSANTLLEISKGMLSIGVCMAVIIGIHDRSLMSKLKIDVAIVLLVTFLILLHGDRSTVLQIIFPLIYAISEFKKPFRLRAIAGALFATMFIFGVSQVARHQYKRSFGGFSSAVTELNAGETIMLSLTTFSQSVFAANAAVYWVPDHHEYYYGKMQLPHILGIIPFSRTALGISGDDYSSARLITTIILGKRSKTGAGSSMVAETYLDFGVPGVAIILAFVGFVLRELQMRARVRPSILYAAVYGIAFGAMANAARSSVMAFLIRQVLYPGLYLYAVSIFLSIPVSLAKKSGGGR